MTYLRRERDNYPVVQWEDRSKTKQKEWAIERLKFYVQLSGSNVSDIRKKWNRTLDHRLVASLAIVSRYHALPDYITNHCNLDQRKDIVLTKTVLRLADGNKDTILKIIKEGIESQELCQVQNPPRYRGICFTAGYTMMKAFEAGMEQESFCYNCSEKVISKY